MDSQRIKTLLEREVDSSTLSIFLVPLNSSCRSVPIMVVLNPQFSKAAFPSLNSLTYQTGIPQAGLSIGLPGIGVECTRT